MRRPLLLVILLAAAQTGPACRFLKSRTVLYPSGVAFPVVEDGSVPFRGRPAGGIRARGGSIYMSTRAGFVWSIDVAGKKAAWKFQTDNRLLEPPFPGAQNIYARDEADVLYALSPGGLLIWKRPVGEKVLTPVVEGGGRVFFGTEKGKLWSVGLDGKDDRVFQAGGAVSGGPLVSGARVIFCSDDGMIHVHDLGGRPLWTHKVPAKVVGPLASDGKFLFFGTEDRWFSCLKIGRARPKWKVRLGGLAAADPVVLGGRLYILGTNSVLYCLRKSGGDVLWWANIPSRKVYDLAVVGDKLIVSSLSAVLLAFDAGTGRKAGGFTAGRDLMANAVWVDPFLVIVHHDVPSDEGKLILLAKEVQVRLLPQKASPQPAGEEIPFSVSVIGFFKPLYEFYLKTGDKREVAQKASEKSTWTWYAAVEGACTVGVAVTDAKLSREVEVPFVIEKRPEKKDIPVSLTPQKASPQPAGEEIPFSVSAVGFSEPRYEFYVKTGDKREVVQKASEKSAWTWHAAAKGTYTVGVTVTDAKQSREVEIPFVIEKRPEKKPGKPEKKETPK
jgi:outer membrane protein assembly factor BamB